MLKIRVIPALLFKEFGLVKSVQFSQHRKLESALTIVRIYNLRQVDELIFLDIDASKNKEKPNLGVIRDISEECFMPLTIGGGISSLEEIQKILKIGADKVAINTMAIKNPEFITEAAKKFGSQCIVVSMDIKNKEVFSHSNQEVPEKDPIKWAKLIEEKGAGEILLTSVDHEGIEQGYDYELIKQISSAVNIPVIALGGAGHLKHFVEAFKSGADAVSASSIFQYTKITPTNVKEYMAEHGINTRLY